MASTIEVDQVKHSSGVAFTLPTADGSAGHLLKTNGSRVLSFVADTDTGITDLVQDTTPQLGGDLSCNSSQIQWSKGADVASATALVLLTDGNYFDVTGTVTITSFNTTAVGTQIKLHFDAACILTHHSSDLVLPTGANITTAAGDEAEFIEYASGDYRCTSYTRASGAALKIADESIDSDHYVDGSIDNAHIADNAVDSEHYAAASIDGEHLAVGKDGALSLDATPDTDHTANGPQTSTLLAGYSTTLMDLVYLDPNGRWEEADADATSSSISLLGIALESKTDGQAMNVALSGSFVADASWSFGVGVPLYVDTTAGGITTTKPSGSGDVVRTVGYSLSATMIYFNPSSDYVTLA